MTEYSPEFSASQTLWFVANTLIGEEGMELARHWEHDCYAGALVMQTLILALYPELPNIPVQPTARDRDWEDWGSPCL